MSVDNPYNLDLESTEAQAVSDKRASETVLKETFRDYFGEMNFFFATKQAELTFSDVVAHIGVDPSEYRYDAERKAQIYTWYAAESSARVMHVWFKGCSMPAAYIISAFRKCKSICKKRGLLRQASFLKAPNPIRCL